MRLKYAATGWLLAASRMVATASANASAEADGLRGRRPGKTDVTAAQMPVEPAPPGWNDDGWDGDAHTVNPTWSPTWSPTTVPTLSPVWKADGWNNDGWNDDGHKPTKGPTLAPTHGWADDGHKPTDSPTVSPSLSPTLEPTSAPTQNPTLEPTLEPTMEPTPNPSASPTGSPTWIEDNGWMKDGWNDDGWNGDGHKPTNGPTLEPTREPHGWNGDGHEPTNGPTLEPTLEPTREPHGWNGDGHEPTKGPTLEPTLEPTGWNGDGHKPTSGPTLDPTPTPSLTCVRVGGESFPLCKKNRSKFCDGDGDCTETNFCDCGAGREFCDTGVNPCDDATLSPTGWNGDGHKPTKRPTLPPTVPPTLDPLEPTVPPTLDPLEPTVPPTLDPLEPTLEPTPDPLEPTLDPTPGPEFTCVAAGGQSFPLCPQKDIDWNDDGWKDDGHGDCPSLESCQKQAKKMGFQGVYKGDYSNVGLYGCFSKGEKAHWGYGGTDAEKTKELSGQKYRILCDESKYCDGDGDCTETNFCDCSIGQEFCDTGVNPCATQDPTLFPTGPSTLATQQPTLLPSVFGTVIPTVNPTLSATEPTRGRRTSSPVNWSNDGWKDDGHGDCPSLESCREQVMKMGFQAEYFYKGDYSNVGLYGCFSKGEKAYWGYGGTEAEATKELSGMKYRIHCKDWFGDLWDDDGWKDDGFPTCVRDGDDSFPLCPHKKDEVQYCDGDGDCTETNFCDCGTGQKFCETGVNPCDDMPEEVDDDGMDDTVGTDKETDNERTVKYKDDASNDFASMVQKEQTHKRCNKKTVGDNLCVKECQEVKLQYDGSRLISKTKGPIYYVMCEGADE